MLSSWLSHVYEGCAYDSPIPVGKILETHLLAPVSLAGKQGEWVTVNGCLTVAMPQVFSPNLGACVEVAPRRL